MRKACLQDEASHLFPTAYTLLAICVPDMQTETLHNTEAVTSFKNVILLPLFFKEFLCVHKDCSLVQ